MDIVMRHRHNYTDLKYANTPQCTRSHAVYLDPVHPVILDLAFQFVTGTRQFNLNPTIFKAAMRQPGTSSTQR